MEMAQQAGTTHAMQSYLPFRPGLLGTLLFVGLVGIAAGGCVSKGKYNELAKERDTLHSQSTALKEDLEAERTRLNQELAETSTRLSATSEELEQMKAKAREQEEVYTNLVKELSTELDSKKITIRQMKTGIDVNMPEDILFASGSARVSESGREVLAKVGKQLEEVPYQILVSGFTDNVPIAGQLAQRYPSNWDLAAARATNVLRLLEENNVPSDKLVAVSYGETQPIASNDDEEGRKQNRRIEIRLRPTAVEEEAEKSEDRP